MLQALAQWYISRSIDGDRAMPAWVQRRMARNRALQQFYHQSQRLAVRMRTREPASHLEEFSSRSKNARPALEIARAQGGRVRLRIACVAGVLAAVLLLSAVPIASTFMRDRAAAPSLPIERIVAPVPIASAEPASLSPKFDRSPQPLRPIDTTQIQELVADSRKLVRSINERATNIAGPFIAGPIVDADRLAACLELDLQDAVAPASKLGASRLGASYGELLSGLDHQVETENRRLLSEGVGAWRFFVHKLPQSAASLAGW